MKRISPHPNPLPIASQRGEGENRLHSSREIVLANGSPARRRMGTVQALGYDADQWSPNRMFVWQPVQTAKRDLDRYSRYELNRKGEYLWKNSFLVRLMIERIVTLIIGSGIFPTPKSTNQKWVDACKKFWKKVCKRPCVDSVMTMSQYQRIKCRGRFKHGESFTVLTHSDRFNCDAIQGLEWFRVSGSNRNAPGVQDYTGVQGCDASTGGDGIDYDAQGYPVRYHIDSLDYQAGSVSPIEPIPEAFMVHHFTPLRDEQTRGETILSSIINAAQDVKEIIEFERMAVKDASTKQDIIQTMSGDYDPEAMSKFAWNTPDGLPTPGSIPDDPAAKMKYYKTVFGGGPVLLRTGDKYTPYIPNRPGNAWQGLMAFLANGIVQVSGLPASLFLPVDIGGTDIRRDLQIGQKVVAALQVDEAASMQKIWEYFIMGGVEDRDLPSPPPDWNEVEWHFTGSLTVDRDKDQMRMRLVEAGLMSRDEYHGENGEDGEAQMQKVVKEVKKTRFLITGIAESEPFASAVEFKQFLNLSETSSLTFREMDANGGEGDAGVGGETPAQKKQRLLREAQPA